MAKRYGYARVSTGEQDLTLQNEVLIAAGVNPADALAVSGKYAKDWGTRLPLIPGYDIAGTVVKVGAAVTRLKRASQMACVASLSRSTKSASAIPLLERATPPMLQLAVRAKP